MKHLIKNTKIFVLLLLAISFTGCQDDDVTLPIVEAGFTHTISQATGVVTFINTSTNADNYSWSFGDESSSTEINPIKMYTSGTYTIVLEAKNNSGASDTFEDTITIAIPEAITIPITFDSSLVIYEATTFNGVAFDVVENPDLSGTNSVASNVGAITNIGASFEGLFFELGAPLDLSTDKTVKINFWSNAALDVLMKLEQGSGADVETSVSHGGTGWEEMIFTFDSASSFSQLTMFVDGPGTTAGTFYVDDIVQIPTVDNVAPTITLNGNASMTVIVGSTYTDPGATATDNIDGDISGNITVGGDTVDVNTIGVYNITYDVSDAAGNAATQVTRMVEVITAPTAPTTSAPVPPARDAADVISIYGDTYTNIAINTYDPNWGQSGHTLVNATYNPGDGNFALAYPNFNYQGTDFTNAQDASTMEFLHVDMWTPADPSATDIQVSPINNGSGSGETLVSIPYTTGTWVSVDLPISDFTGMTWDSVFQMKFAANAPGSTVPVDIYLDNVYFYRAPSGGGGGGGGGGGAYNLTLPVDFEANGFGANWSWNVFENDSNPPLEFVANPDASGINTSAQVAKITALQAGQPFVGTETVHGTMGITWDISASNAIVKIMVYKTKISDVGIKFATPSGGAQPELKVANTLINQWEELTFDFTSYIGLGDTTGVDQIIVFPDFIARTADDIIYFDNITFSSN